MKENEYSGVQPVENEYDGEWYGDGFDDPGADYDGPFEDDDLFPDEGDDTYYYSENADPYGNAAASENDAFCTWDDGYEPPARRLRPVWQLVVIDFLCFAAGLVLFALFHHVIDLTPKSEPVVLPVATPAPTPSPTPVPAEEPETAPARVYSGVWGEKFSEYFTEGEIFSDDTQYRSENIAITYTEVDGDGLLYRVADIHVSDLKYIRVGFSFGEYGHSAEDVNEFIKRYQPILGLSGDYYLGRREGIVVRDGVMYRDTADTADLCVLYEDGTMKCMPASELTAEKVLEGGIRDVWTFGPTLVTDGHAVTNFNTISNIADRTHPRTAIGYVEPGHYVFIQVDGRIAKTNGMKLSPLAELFVSFGCTEAYNLDGGASSAMVWNNKLVSYRYGRPLCDMIYIAELPEEPGDVITNGEESRNG